MRVFNGFDALPRFANPVVTVGSYDGVHAGHRKLLATISDIARETGGESVVITFSPHPRTVLAGGGEVKLLTGLAEKTLLLAEAGVDNLIVAPFTQEFSRLSSHDFVRQYLIDKVGVRTLVVGYNHHFGHNKSGNFDYLRSMSSEFGFDIYMVPRHDVDDEKVSSTTIRNLIDNGQVAAAAKYLGYRYFIIGALTEGGRFTPGEASKLLPPAGVYQVELRLAAAGGGKRLVQPSAPGGCGLPALQDKAGETSESALRAELYIANDGTLRLELPVAVRGGATVTFI